MVENGNEIKTIDNNTNWLPDKDWKKEKELVKQIVAKDCTDTELKYLFYMADKYALDPLKKQVFAMKYSKEAPVIIMVSHAGLLSLAWKSKQFGSMETKVEINEKDNFTPKRPLSATTTIYRKDFEKPFIYQAFFDEFVRPTTIWKERPKTMITKCAEANALRRAFDVSGLFIEEEMPPIQNNNVKVVEVKGETNE